MTRLGLRLTLAALVVVAAATAASAQQADDPVTRAMRRADAAVVAAEAAPVLPPTAPDASTAPAATETPDEARGAGTGIPTTGRADLDRIVADASAEHGVDRRLVVALMRHESGFRRDAVSPKGAAGYMQLMPATARRFGVTDVFDARQNIHAGVRYLRLLLDMFGGDRKLALAAYNAGEGRVGAVMGRTGVRQFDELARRGLLPAETRAYVPAILAWWTRLGGVALTPSRPAVGEIDTTSGRRVDAPAALGGMRTLAEAP